MPTLALSFPAHRYHATPWGHHVNEGQIEWPPSPWRLLRALISSGYCSGAWDKNGPDELARSLLLKLAGVLPRYSLPFATGAHSRHYMPMAVFDGGREKTTLVFDTWARVGGELGIVWDVPLTSDESQLLGRLAEGLGYLGRSESWVQARLQPDCASSFEFNCIPCESEYELRPGHEQVSVLATQTAAEYTAWRNRAFPALASEAKLSAKEKKTRENQVSLYPADLIAALQVETQWLRRHGWSQPPGSRRAFYWRKMDAMEVGGKTCQPRLPSQPAVQAILLALNSESGNPGLLPTGARTLPQAELFHSALVSRRSEIAGHSFALTGHDSQGQPLRGAHEHAHVLPLDLDDDDHLDHVLLWAPMGLDERDQAAARALRRNWTKGSDQPLRVAVAGMGGLDDLRRLPQKIGARLLNVLAPGDGATTWISRTPFVPPRHLRYGGKRTLESQVIAELACRRLPEPVEIEVFDPRSCERARVQRHFIRARSKGPQPFTNMGFTLRLRFATAISGPLALGYGSHFGLGLFEAATN